MKSKLRLGRILCGAVMAATAVIYCLGMSGWGAYFGNWRAWLPLFVLLFVEFDVYDGIEYFLSDRCFHKPKLFKRVNIVGGCIVLLGGLAGYPITVFRWEWTWSGLVMLPLGALMLMVLGHGVNCFFDSLRYFLHEKEKRWYWTAWNITKIAAAPFVVLGAVLGAGVALLFIGFMGAKL